MNQWRLVRSMDKTIFKYILDDKINVFQKIEMPSDADIVRVDRFNSDICMWAIVDPASSSKSRTFRILGTGWNFDDNHHYVGTFYDGSFVWHVFEIKSVSHDE